MVQLIKYSAAGALFLAAVNAAPKYAETPVSYEEDECTDEPEYPTSYPAASATVSASYSAGYPTGYPVPTNSYPVTDVSSTYPATETSYTTTVYTITSCAPDVKDCPYGSVTTTVVPCTETGTEAYPTTSATGEYPTGEYPTGEYPTGEYPTKSEEYPTGEYPTGEYPTKPTGVEYPTKSEEEPYPTKPAEEYPTGEYPTGEYPTGEYPTKPAYPVHPSGYPTTEYPHGNASYTVPVESPYPTIPTAGVAAVRVGATGAVIAAAGLFFALF